MNSVLCRLSAPLISPVRANQLKPIPVGSGEHQLTSQHGQCRFLFLIRVSFVALRKLYAAT